MKTFSYKAVSPKNQFITGTLQAQSVDHLAATLKVKHYQLISCKRCVLPKIDLGAQKNILLYEFCYGMSYLLSSGIHLDEALQVMQLDHKDKEFKATLERVTQSIHSGKSLKEACAIESRFFDPTFLLLIETGEKSGSLGNSFESLSDLYLNAQEIKEKLKKAYRYPLFLMGLMVIAFYVMMTFLVPNLVDFLVSMDQELPMATRSLIFLSNGVREYHFLLLFFVISTMFLVILNPISAFKAFVQKVKIRVPYFGRLSKNNQQHLFFNTLSVLIKNGVSLIDALQMLIASQKNESFSPVLQSVANRILEGNTFSQSIKESDWFDAGTSQIIAVGEKSAKLGGSLKHIAEYQKRELEKNLNALIGAIEPIMLLIMGGMLVWIIMGTIYPLYDSFSKINV